MNVEPCKWSHAGDNEHREFVLPGPFKKDGVTGKKVCQDCCRFLGWVWADREEKPVEKTASISPDRDLLHLLQTRLSEMVENDWEQTFLKDLSKRNNWSAKQLQAFERIRSKFFEISNENKEEKNAGSEQPKPQPVDDDDFVVPF